MNMDQKRDNHSGEDENIVMCMRIADSISDIPGTLEVCADCKQTVSMTYATAAAVKQKGLEVGQFKIVCNQCGKQRLDKQLEVEFAGISPGQLIEIFQAMRKVAGGDRDTSN